MSGKTRTKPKARTKTGDPSPVARHPVEALSIDLVVADPRNPRKHPQSQIDLIARSLRRFGQRRPVVVRRDGDHFVLVAGHATTEAALSCGMTSIAAVVVDDDEAAAREYMLVDNRSAELSAWDDDLLQGLLAEMDAEIVAGLGFEIPAPASMHPEAGIDPEELPDADAAQERWRVALGDVWEIGGKHRLAASDSANDGIARVMAGERAEMVWSDPPYGVAYVGKGNQGRIQNDALSSADLQSLLERALGKARETSVGGAALYVAQPGGGLEPVFWNAIKAAGWDIRQQLVWVKDVFVLGHSDYHYQHEPIILAYAPQGHGRKGRGGERWWGDNKQSTVLAFDRPKASKLHPTMKPVALVAAMVSNSCPPRGCVLDPFSGSGTTIAACEATGRVGRGVELDLKFAAVTLQRFADAGMSVVRLERG